MQTTLSPLPSQPRSMTGAQSLCSSPTLPPPRPPSHLTSTPLPPSSTVHSQWETLPGCPFPSPPTRSSSRSIPSGSPSSPNPPKSCSLALRTQSTTRKTFKCSQRDFSTQTPSREAVIRPPLSSSQSTLMTSPQWESPPDLSPAQGPLSAPTPTTAIPSAGTPGGSATLRPGAPRPTPFAHSAPSTTPI